jgi:hypothetical protein
MTKRFLSERGLLIPGMKDNALFSGLQKGDH